MCLHFFHVSDQHYFYILSGRKLTLDQNSFILPGFTFIYVEVFPVILGDVTVLVDGVPSHVSKFEYVLSLALSTTMTPIDATLLIVVMAVFP